MKKNDSLYITLPCFLFLFMFCISPIQAQQPKEKAIKLAETKLDTMFNHLQSLESLEASFSLEILDAYSKSIAKQEGKVLLKDNKYELQIGDQYIYSDGSTMWVYNKLFNEVQINDYTNDEDNLFSVENLFSGKLQNHQLLSKLNKMTEVNGVLCDEIELTPTDKTKPFFKLLLWINPKTNNIEKARVFAKTGAQYLYTTYSMKKNQQMASNFGQFNASLYPGIEIVDLR